MQGQFALLVTILIELVFDAGTSESARTSRDLEAALLLGLRRGFELGRGGMMGVSIIFHYHC
jgi:hypothetical protein